MMSQPPAIKAAKISMILFFLRFEKKDLIPVFIPSSHLKMLPIVLDPLHELLEAWLAAPPASRVTNHFSHPIFFSSSLYLGSERNGIKNGSTLRESIPIDRSLYPLVSQSKALSFSPNPAYTPATL